MTEMPKPESKDRERPVVIPLDPETALLTLTPDLPRNYN
jgi:hypothetical protein